MHYTRSFRWQAFPALAVVVGLTGASCSAQPAERRSLPGAWNKIAAVEGTRPDAGGRIIEGVPLVKTEEGISTAAACLSSLLAHQLALSTVVKQDERTDFKIPKRDDFFRFYSMRILNDISRRFDNPKNKKLGRDANRKVFAIIGKHTAKAEERVKQADAEVKGKPYKTWRVKNAYLLETYLREFGGPAQALHAFASERKLAVELQEESPATFTRLRESVDRGAPVLLREGDNAMLCVGYVMSDGEALLVVLRPGLAEYREQTGKDNVNPKDLASDVPWIKNAVASQMKQIRYFDHELRRTADMPKGVDIITFDGPQFDALYVGPWVPDIDDVVAEIEREVGLVPTEKRD